ncbi:alanine racemase [Cochlodiniinecator piscidefendens]|uniref:alanine racemase n=1 Tax=Cochlodiniinecator piscidefendens TaxID=2715756 RepID=UPI0014080AF7|nr:alanine racemase [Cochlodiniinecator piscidefendens]
MGTGTLKIDLDAVVANWRALDAMTASHVETTAVVKADAYGLGAARVAKALAKAGARKFFVAVAEEGAAVRQALGPGPEVCVFSGHMRGDTDMIHDLQLTPMVNSLEQLTRQIEALPGHAFGVQLDSGMGRLGMSPDEWAAVRHIALSQNPMLIMSHLACSDEPDHAMNALQLTRFKEMTDGIETPRSLAATGGTLLGSDYHFDLVRPGIGLYGGFPYQDAQNVVTLTLPVVQIREVAVGETVGYSNSWTADRPSKIATVSAGYADGLLRKLSDRALLWCGSDSCKLAGRVSMDLLTVDVTDLHETPRSLDILCEHQNADQLAEIAETIGYEILTSLGARYTKRYVEGHQ